MAAEVEAVGIHERATAPGAAARIWQEDGESRRRQHLGQVVPTAVEPVAPLPGRPAVDLDNQRKPARIFAARWQDEPALDPQPVRSLPLQRAHVRHSDAVQLWVQVGQADRFTAGTREVDVVRMPGIGTVERDTPRSQVDVLSGVDPAGINLCAEGQPLPLRAERVGTVDAGALAIDGMDQHVISSEIGPSSESVPGRAGQ